MARALAAAADGEEDCNLQRCNHLFLPRVAIFPRQPQENYIKLSRDTISPSSLPTVHRHSYGAFDKDALATIVAARQASIRSVDAYLFPCPTKDPGAQVKGMVEMLSR